MVVVAASQGWTAYTSNVVQDLDVSSDDLTLAVAAGWSVVGEVSLLDAVTGGLLLSDTSSGGIYATAFSQNDDELVAAGSRDDIYVFDTSTMTLPATAHVHDGDVYGVDVAPSGALAITTGYGDILGVDASTALIDTATWSVVEEHFHTGDWQSYDCGFAPDGARYATLVGGRLMVYDTASHALLLPISVSSDAEDMTWSYDSEYVAVASTPLGSVIEVVSPISGFSIGALASGVPPTGVAFAHTRNTLFIGYADGWVETWTVTPTGLTFQFLFQAHTAEVYSLALSSDDEILYTGSFAGEIREWDLTWL